MMFRLSFLLISLLAAIVPLHAAPLASATRLVSSSSDYAKVAPVSRTFHVTTAGTHTVTLTDVGSSGVNMSLLITRDNTQVARLDHAGLTSFAATAGDYTVQVIGDGDHSAAFSVDISGTTSVLNFNDTLNARQIPTPDTDLLDVTFEVPADGNYTVDLTDFEFPVALNAVTLTVQKAGQAALLGTLNTAGSMSFNTTAGTHRLLVYATVSSSTHAGVYSVTVTHTATSTTLYDTTRTIDTTASSTNLLAYNYPLHIDSAGSYTVEIKDLNFPQNHSLSWASSVFEGATALVSGDTSPATMTFVVTGAADVYIPVVVTPSSSDGNGLFWIRVKSASGAVLLEKTQAVGSAVQTVDITVPEAGFYDVTLNDLLFPRSLTSLEMVVTSGSLASPVIQRFTGEGIKNLSTLAAATYVVGIYAVPDATDHYGVIGYRVDGPVSRPAPVINSLTASQLEVASGASITVSWSTSNANSCITNGWSSSTALADAVTVGPLTADRTLTLTCTGDGGTTSQSLSIHVTSASSNDKGGGGGALGWELLVLLVGAGVMRRGRNALSLSRST